MRMAAGRKSQLKRQEQFTTIILVVIGFGVTLGGTLVGASLPYTLGQAMVACFLGLLYIAFLLSSDTYLSRFPSPWGILSYFAIQFALVLSSQFLLIGPGTWLISLPLVALAVEKISPRWRWPIYLVAAGSLAVFIGIRTGDWANAFNTPLLMIPAMFFVVVFTKLRLNEQEARRSAELLSTQLEKAHDQLASYAVQVEDLATTKERNRLAREIHDNLGHYLTVAIVQLEAAKSVMEHDPARALDALGKAQNCTKDGLAAVRQSVAALRESPIGGRSLADALVLLLEEMHMTGIVADFEILGEKRKLKAKTKLTLYRVVQEGLTNVRKHARASRVDVILDYGDAGAELVRVVLKDNGVGTTMTDNGGYGLVGMRERVQLLNGDFHIESAPGKGFLIKVAVPD